MKNRTVLSLLLAGTMTAALLAIPAQAAEQQPQTPAPYAISADHWSREDFSQEVNPEVFTGVYSRELYNAIRQTMVDGTSDTAPAFTMVGKEDYSAVKKLVGRMEGVTESSEFLITLFSSFSQAESESMGLNIVMGMRQSMKEGKIPFQYSRTLGYRRGPDGKPEIDPEEAETVRLIYSRYLEGRSLVEIQRELTAKNIPTAEGVQGWSRQVIRNILTSEKYIGDGLRQKTYTTGPIGNKKVVKNNGELPMYYARDNHPAIIPREIYYRVKEEMARRISKRKVLQKTAKTEQGKYSAKYALSELLICGECGTPYKRCTWARNGKKRIVWRCVSRLEFGTKYCHNSPTLDEDRLHRAIVAALNEYGAIRTKVKADVLELAELARSGGEDGGVSLLQLRQRLDALTAEQSLLLDKILEDMNSSELNAQLETVTAKKQSILDQIAACQQDEEQRAAQASRQREMEEWLDQQPMCFTEYDDTLTRRFVEQITVVDAESIQVKIRDTEIVIDRKIC